MPDELRWQDVGLAGDEHGVVTTEGLTGEAAIMARYSGKFAIYTASIPLPGDVPAGVYEGLPRRTFVDGLVWDNAPSHRDDEITDLDLGFVGLPPYSPELNPVERVWQDLRKWLGATLPADLQALKEHVATILRSYTNEALSSITSYPYLKGICSAQSV